MMSRTFAAMLGLTLAASAGPAGAEETTRVFRQGGSTAVVTQEGGGSATVRRTVTGPDSQSIVVRQGPSTAVIRQQDGSAASFLQMLRDWHILRFLGSFDWITPQAGEQESAAAEEEAAEEDEAPRSPVERRISREFGMDLQVSDSFRSRFLDRIDPR